MKRPEKLPPGYERLPSLSIRVRIRAKGHAPVTSTFPLLVDTPEERRHQRLAADAWAAAARRRLLSGTHVSTREAETTTLREALLKYEAEKLDGKPTNVRKEKVRIKQILADPISERSIASLRKTDIGKYRDRLQAEAKEKRGIELARTTITNKIQLISRALNFVGETIEGVPNISGTQMPKARHGRERRPSNDELSRIVATATSINQLLPLIIRFALTTALRKEKILEFCLNHIQDASNGVRIIKFPNDHSVPTKRTGIIPITRELQVIIDEVVQLRHVNNDETPVFKINVNTLDHQWKKVLKLEKISDLHFHDLRHEATSRLFEKGLNVAEVMTITGHSTLEMVDRYSHYSVCLVLEKLEHRLAPQRLAENIRLIVDNYARAGGDLAEIKNLVISLF